MDWIRGAVVALFSLSLSLAAAEAGLRLQQRLGPYIDLELHNVSNIPSEDLNHVHAEREDWWLRDPARYGSRAGLRYSALYDGNGLRRDPECAAQSAEGDSNDILFLGDSFMEGYDLDNTVPRHVCRWLRHRGAVPPNARFLNAGTSSYSPTIFIVQAKRLIPRLRPRVVVVDIDETDLGDDYLRYRDLVQRDHLGRIVAVHSTSANREFTTGFLRIKEARHRLYLVRFLRRALHTRLTASTTLARAEIEAVDPLLYSRDSEADAAERYGVEIRLFEARVDELVATLVELSGDPGRILLAYHPHLGHLRADASGHTWNRFVSSTIERVAGRRQVRFYDATADFQRRIGERPQDYYWPGDMHLNFEGLALYGQLLGQEVEKLLASAGPG